MAFLKKAAAIFWNQNEKRLRAVWRIGLHTVVLLVLTSVFTVAPIFLAVAIDLIAGTNLQSVVAGVNPLQIVENPWIGTVIVPAATLLGVLLTTFMAGKWVDRRKFREFGLTFSKGWWIDFVFGLGLGVLLMSLIFLGGWLSGNVDIVGYFVPFPQDESFLSGFIRSVIFFLFVGIYEEILSRGYHLINLAEGFYVTGIGKRWALMLAFLVSSLIFGVLHIGNPNASWLSTLNISLAGVFLGLGMVLTGSLAIPIGLHITWNLFQGNVYGFPVSGIKTGATIIATDLIGPEWLMGGLFGPEAGLLGLAAMVIGSGLTILWVRRKGRLILQSELAVYDQPNKAEVNCEITIGEIRM